MSQTGSNSYSVLLSPAEDMCNCVLHHHTHTHTQSFMEYEFHYVKVRSTFQNLILALKVCSLNFHKWQGSIFFSEFHFRFLPPILAKQEEKETFLRMNFVTNHQQRKCNSEWIPLIQDKWGLWVAYRILEMHQVLWNYSGLGRIYLSIYPSIHPTAHSSIHPSISSSIFIYRKKM